MQTKKAKFIEIIMKFINCRHQRHHLRSPSSSSSFSYHYNYHDLLVEYKFEWMKLWKINAIKWSIKCNESNTIQSIKCPFYPIPALKRATTITAAAAKTKQNKKRIPWNLNFQIQLNYISVIYHKLWLLIIYVWKSMDIICSSSPVCWILDYIWNKFDPYWSNYKQRKNQYAFKWRKCCRDELIV